MGSIRRIGQPSPRPPDNEAEIHPESTPIAPSLFGVPNSSNLHASGFVHCRVSRVGNGRYHFSFMTEDAESVSMVANRKAACRTSNYHLFDALRGGLDATLSKKSGHYIGKLRRDKGQPRGCYTLYNSSREKEECAAYVYDIPALRQTVNEGVPPRKMQAVIQKPPKDNVRVNVPPNNRLLEHLHNGTWKHTLLIACQTRSPRFSDGVYRLNFHGRVLKSSVKNMQLENDKGECLLQFGRVDDKAFHLDYKAPFTAYTAFGAAICQFDL